jgi:hypothetical protein
LHVRLRQILDAPASKRSIAEGVAEFGCIDTLMSGRRPYGGPREEAFLAAPASKSSVDVSGAQTISLGELHGDCGDEFALVPRAVEVELARLTLAFAVCDHCRPIGRAANDFLEPVGQPSNDHAEAQEVLD